MYLIEGNNIDYIYQQLCGDILKMPQFTPAPRGMQIKEFTNALLVLNKPQNRVVTIPERETSMNYLAGEFAFYMSGSNKLKNISHYSKFWNHVSDNGRTVNSGYGYKLFKKRTKRNNQFEYAMEQLLRDKDSRKAIMEIYTAENANVSTKDNPCTMYLQFFIRENKLDCHCYMRSNDIWFGLTYDIPFFTIIQELLLIRLRYYMYPDLNLGRYYHNVGSLHVYEKNFDQVRDVSFKEYKLYRNFFPPMTIETYKQLPDFLKWEKRLRLHNEDNTLIYFNDPFLQQMKHYLLWGKR